MKKLIIDNQTGLPLKEIFPYINAVIDEGKISNNGKQHCYATIFDKKLVVVSILNKKSERLLVYNHETT